MEYNIIKVHQGNIADEETSLTLIQLCNTCQVRPEFVIEMVDFGILEPEGEKRTAWRFRFSVIYCTKLQYPSKFQSFDSQEDPITTAINVF